MGPGVQTDSKVNSWPHNLLRHLEKNFCRVGVVQIMVSSGVCALWFYPLGTPVPVGATFVNPPHLNAFERPLGSHCHVDVTVPVEVQALCGSRALRSHSPTGMKNPFFGCT